MYQRSPGMVASDDQRHSYNREKLADVLRYARAVVQHHEGDIAAAYSSLERAFSSGYCASQANCLAALAVIALVERDGRHRA